MFVFGVLIIQNKINLIDSQDVFLKDRECILKHLEKQNKNPVRQLYFSIYK